MHTCLVRANCQTGSSHELQCFPLGDVPEAMKLWPWWYAAKQHWVFHSEGDRDLFRRWWEALAARPSFLLCLREDGTFMVQPEASAPAEEAHQVRGGLPEVADAGSTPPAEAGDGPCPAGPGPVTVG